MKINNFGYLVKEGIRGIFLHGFMSFAAVCVTVACLLIVGSFYSLLHNVNIIVEDLNKTNEVLVYINPELSDSDAMHVGSAFTEIDNIQSARFIPRTQALADFKAAHNNDPAFDGVRAEDLRHRFSITLYDNAVIEDTVKELKQVEGVADVSAAYKIAKGFATLERVLQVASMAVIIVLLAVSLLIISNTVKLAMYDRRDEIAIMKMVGATNGFIRLPFVVEGFTLGMLGAVIAFGLEWLLYDGVLLRLETMEETIPLFNFVPFTDLLLPMVLVFVGAGMFVGIVGSWTSIRKFMDV